MSSGLGARKTVPFVASLEEAQGRSLVSNKPVLAIFGAVWCASCKAFRKNTLTSPRVLGRADDFEWVFVNIDREVSLARKYGVKFTPQSIVIHPSGRILSQADGNLAPADYRDFLDDALRTAALTASDELFDAPPNRVEAEDLTRLTWTPEGYRGVAICYSHVGYGPFDVPSQAPTAVLRLSPRPRTPSTLSKGQTEVRWNETITNFWAVETGKYRLDYGALTSSFAVAYGVTDTVQVEFELHDFRRFDSVLDIITDSFHSLFGLDDSGRDDFHRAQNVLSVNQVNGTGGVVSQSENTHSDDFAITVQHNVTCGTEDLPAFSYALTVRRNVGGNIPISGGSNLSFGLSTSVARRLGEEFYTYAGLSYVWHGQDEWRGLPLEDTQVSLLFAGEWRYAPRMSWVLQYLWTEAAADEIAPFDDPTHEFNIGWKGELGGGYVVEISLLENAIVVDNSPDFGFHLGFSKRF